MVALTQQRAVMTVIEVRAHTIPQFCKRNNIGRTTTYGEIRSGRLKAKKVGSRTIITSEAEDEWLDSLPDAVDPEATTI